MTRESRSTIGVGGYECTALEKENVNKVLESGRLSYGPWSQRFEETFARVHGCKYAVFCNSGTSALHIALAAMKEKNGWNDDDEVIVPATTFIASSNVVFYNNLKPVFVDVEPSTYNLNPALLEKVLTEKTRAIMPVHLFGQPCDMRPVMEFAAAHKLRVIEDSCETMFAKYCGRSVGSFGDIGCFSTYIAHLLVTGVGGFATTNDSELYILLRSLMNHGRDSIYLSIDDDNDADAGKMKQIIEKRFSFVRFGHSFRATELEAAIGCAQLENMHSMIEKRQRNAKIITQLLSPFEEFLQLPKCAEDRDHVFMMYPIVIKKGAPFTKQALTNALEMEENIETRDMLPLINQPIYRNIFKNPEQYPVSKWVVENGFYVGSHPYLSDSDLERIGCSFKKVITQLTNTK